MKPVFIPHVCVCAGHMTPWMCLTCTVKKTTSDVQRKYLQIFFMGHEPLTQASISESPFLDIT